MEFSHTMVGDEEKEEQYACICVLTRQKTRARYPIEAQLMKKRYPCMSKKRVI